jgi:hypothetical protein
MYNSFRSPDLSDDLHTTAVNYFETVTQKRKGMPGHFDSKTLRLIGSGIRAGVRCLDSNDMGRQTRHVHTDNAHKPPTEGNFCDKTWERSAIVDDYSMLTEGTDQLPATQITG